jgi:hypothetical protein
VLPPLIREVDIAARVSARVAACSAIVEADPLVNGLEPAVLKSMRKRIEADLERGAEMYYQATNRRPS